MVKFYPAVNRAAIQHIKELSFEITSDSNIKYDTLESNNEYITKVYMNDMIVSC